MINPTSTPWPVSTLMSTEDRVWLRRAAELRGSLARSERGIGNGMGYAVFGVLSLVFACVGYREMDLAIAPPKPRKN